MDVVSEVLSAVQDVAERPQVSSRLISRDFDLFLEFFDWPAGRRIDSVYSDCSVDVSA